MTARRPRAHGDCRDLMLSIARGLERDLGAGERRALARHLRRCRRCGAFSDGLEQTVALLRRLGQEPLGTQARGRARANIAQLIAGAPAKAGEAAKGLSPSRPRRVTRRAGRRAPTRAR